VGPHHQHQQLGRPIHGQIAEYAAKAAMTNLAVGLAKVLSKTGVTVNTGSPGTVRTEAFDWVAAGGGRAGGAG
jgi:NAD(P)-dependent dehydrogenase (short-subunit alcohol dehydrogenase family)